MEQKSLTRLVRKNSKTFLCLSVFAVIGCGAGSAPSTAEARGIIRVCKKKDAGVWAYGEAPSACDAATFGDVDRAQRLYGSVIFDRRNSSDKERMEYVTNIHAIMRDMADAYIRRREPGATEEDVQAWVRAFMAVANQETFLSHYRFGIDGQLKLMTGDAVQSHGMMQIHQRFHGSRGRDNSFDLVGNMLYGIELFYNNFQIAKNSSCVKRQSAAARWTSAVRSAYGIYNGGEGAVCRWTRPRDKWAANDKGYWAKYKAQPWKQYVTSSVQAAPINVNCLINGDELCSRSVAAVEPKAEHPVILPDGRMCLMIRDQELSCVSSSRMFQCMEAYNETVSKNQPIKLRTMPKMKVSTAYDRNALCQATVKDLVSVGDLVRLNADIKVRDKIDGAVIGTAKKGSVYQVLDFEIRANKSERFYKVQFSTKRSGYIFAGNNEDHLSWVSKTEDASSKLLLPRIGSTVKVVARNGVVLRQLPDDKAEQVEKVKKGTQFKVEAVLVRQSTNELFLRVSHNGQTRYFYAGRTYPELTVSSWVQVTP